MMDCNTLDVRLLLYIPIITITTAADTIKDASMEKNESLANLNPMS
jgi:hypothetical protein